MASKHAVLVARPIGPVSYSSHIESNRVEGQSTASRLALQCCAYPFQIQIYVTACRTGMGQVNDIQYKILSGVLAAANL